MKKLATLIVPLIIATFIIFPITVIADLGEGVTCRTLDNRPILVNGELQKCTAGLICKQLGPYQPGETPVYHCKKSTEVEGVIGQIAPPDAVARLGFGADGLSNFFNTAIQLIYIIAGLLFVFMVIVSALQWITSGGDKEAVANARNRLTFAIIGIVVLALAFVIIRVLGQITGFEFFAGQNP